MSNFNELKSKYKHIAPDELVNRGLLTNAKKSGYICPFCSNGLGDDGTGAEYNPSNDGYKGFCFKCGRHFDVFDLIADRLKIDVSLEFAEVMAEAKELFDDKPKVEDKKPVQKKPQDFEKLIRYAIKNLPDFMQTRKDWRGLTIGTLQHFAVGYVPQWRADNTPRIIIPTSTRHYLARYPFDTADKDINLKPHRGNKEIFGLPNAQKVLSENCDVFVFAVEGEIDAMSLYQCGFTAIAFSGSDISKAQQSLLTRLPKETKLILMLDSDETGKSKTPKVKGILEKLGFLVSAQFLDEKFADANAWLQTDQRGLTAELSRIYNSVTFNPPAESPQKSEGDNPPGKAQTSDGGLSKSSQGDRTDDLIKDCPISLAVPHGYKFTSDGVLTVKSDKIFTHTPPVPVRILSKVPSGEELVDLAVYNKINGWRTKRVRQVDIACVQNVANLIGAGISVTSGRAKYLSSFLTDIQHTADNPQKIPRALIYEQTGWLGTKCDKFIYPPAGENYIVQNGGFSYEETFATRGEKSDWFALFSEAYCESVGVRYACGLALAAPLLKVCGVANIQGALVAKSGSGKSAIAKLAASIYGDPEKFHTTFNSTGNFVNDVSPKFNDLFCWIDEFQSADKKLRENFQQVIINHAEGITRGRENRNGDQKRQLTFRGTRILTSEENILREGFTQGAHKRLIELQAQELITDPLAVKIHQTIQNSFGHFGKPFIEYVAAHKDAILETYRDFLENLFDRDDFIPAHLQHLSLVYTALCHFAEFLESLGFKLPHLPIEYFAAEDKKFWEKLLPSAEKSSNAFRAIDFISELRFTHSKYFVREGNDIFVPAELAPTLGVMFKNGDTGFYPGALGNLLQANDYPPVQSIMRDLAAENLITTGNSKTHKYQICKRLTEGDHARWFYYFPASTFEA